jgi:hypothetical protein
VARKKAETKAEGHALARGEKVIATRDLGDGTTSAVTDAGRKVVLDADGYVISRSVGPAYPWEMAEPEDEDPTSDSE